MIYTTNVKWVVMVPNRVAKAIATLPKSVADRFAALAADIEASGPVRGNWKNYSKLGQEKHHCHLKSGRPTYVTCWQVLDKNERLVEVYYVGTHENAPY